MELFLSPLLFIIIIVLLLLLLLLLLIANFLILTANIVY